MVGNAGSGDGVLVVQYVDELTTEPVKHTVTTCVVMIVVPPFDSVSVFVCTCVVVTVTWPRSESVFVVLEPLTLPAAAGIAEAMRAAIEVPETPRATASIGLAAGVVVSIAAFEALHACADEAMYAAKRNGGNRIALAEPVDGGSIDREIRLQAPAAAQRHADVDAH